MRPPKAPSTARSLVRGSSRSRNLERRYVPTDSFGETYGYVAGGGTLTHGTTVYYDLSGDSPGDPPVTDAPDVYTASAFAAGPAAGKWALQINQQGFYRIHGLIQIISEELDATLHERATELLFEGTMGHALAGFQSGSQNSMLLGYQSFVVFVVIGGTGYKRVGLQTTNNDVAGAPSALAYLDVTRRDSRDWSTLPIPP